jgi:hypothetical protein
MVIPGGGGGYVTHGDGEVLDVEVMLGSRDGVTNLTLLPSTLSSRVVHRDGRCTHSHGAPTWNSCIDLTRGCKESESFLFLRNARSTG